MGGGLWLLEVTANRLTEDKMEDFDILLTVHLNIFILILNNLMH